MLIKRSFGIDPAEITPKELYLNRRQFMARATMLAAAGIAGSGSFSPGGADGGGKLPKAKRGQFVAPEEPTARKHAATYNNFYEFSTGKEDVADLAKSLKTRPWTVSAEGLAKKPQTFDIDKLIKLFPLEERVYRFRCVEAWSMVVPWIGFPLADLIKQCGPAPKAKFVEFTTLYDPSQMPGQKRSVLDWPYKEGLRMDEALHPLALLAVGMYGEALPNQNGAPIRLIVPWKYGFKSIKSIVKIRFTGQMPVTSWMAASPGEYGFYANVNPDVDHPRWSQKTERRLGEFLKRPTLPFNGYADQVAHLYQGMDLKKFF